jgi:hypothetical protein
MPNWIELPVHPPEARRVQIHNLSQGTTYQFQVYRTVLVGLFDLNFLYFKFQKHLKGDRTELLSF